MAKRGCCQRIKQFLIRGIPTREKIKETFTLHWKDLNLECAFLATRRAPILESARNCFLVFVVGFFTELCLRSVFWDYYKEESTPGRTAINRLSNIVFIVMLIVSTIIFAIIRTPYFTKKMYTSHLEAFISAVCCVMSVLWGLGERYYCAEMQGIDVEELTNAEQSDTFFLVGLVVVTTAPTVLIPLRLHLIWIVQLCGLTVYLVMSHKYGAVHTKNITNIRAALTLIAWLSGMGKARFEKEERRQFMAKIEEKRNFHKRTDGGHLMRTRRMEHDQDIERLKEEFAKAIEWEDVETIKGHRHLLKHGLRWTMEQIGHYEAEIRKEQSIKRGIRLEYLISKEFKDLAMEASGKEDPTFNDLKVFFLGDSAIGRDTICPRDGHQGCALVDTYTPYQRATCTHFLSWTWSYKVSLVCECLKRWVVLSQQDFSQVSMFICFFVNNQYRIFAPTLNMSNPTAKGSDNLEETLEGSLKRIGNMVALLDTYDNSAVYLTRIWTIFEQFKAMTMNVPVAMVMPEHCAGKMIQEFGRGKKGIESIRDSLTKVNSFEAKASDPADANKVKKMIMDSVGFEAVDNAITEVIQSWVADELRGHLNKVMHIDENQLAKMRDRKKAMNQKTR